MPEERAAGQRGRRNCQRSRHSPFNELGFWGSRWGATLQKLTGTLGATARIHSISRDASPPGSDGSSVPVMVTSLRGTARRYHVGSATLRGTGPDCAARSYALRLT